MKTLIWTIFLAGALATASAAQPLAISELDESEYFDFWMGEWELTWEGADGNIGRGSNLIRKILGGQVIEENFRAEEGQMAGYEGKSYSVYNPRTGAWKQTWVDNQGGYLDFMGAIDGDRRIFRREGLDPQGNTILQRMVFYDITRDSLIWDWERSTDGGESWELRWRIKYTRR